MTKPIFHATISVKKWGGKLEDYLPIHHQFDEPKIAHAAVNHRIIFHSAYGCYLIEKIFGPSLVNSDGKLVSTRDVAEQHIIDDLGYIPSLDEWLAKVPVEDWMMGSRTNKRPMLVKD